MSWRDLLPPKDEFIVLPWVGGRSLRFGARGWRLEGPLPLELGWYQFRLEARKAFLVETGEPDPSMLKHLAQGYLVGDRLVPLRTSDVFSSERVYLTSGDLDRFSLISAGRLAPDLPLVFIQQEMPLGPESDVQAAYLDGTTLNGIKGVSPALAAAFNLAVEQKRLAEQRRAELAERLRREGEARQLEARRQEIVERLGDGEGRRHLAHADFETAARAALAMAGAEYLEHRDSARGEMVVRFRLNRRRFECVCDRNLRIIDAGICLTEHDHDGEFEEGTRGDTFFTLESLPAVIQEADREGKLVVFRHV